MTELSSEAVLHVAEISRLKLSEAEAQELAKELNQILSEFSKISEIREKGSEVHYIRRPKTQLRKDEPSKTDAALLVEGFSESEEGFMSAPKSL